jgi:hypothetical protein
VGGVREVEVEGLEQLDQAVPVVIGVGRFEDPLLVPAEAGSLGFVLAEQVDQGLLAARGRVDHVADQAVGGLDGRCGDPEQDALLAGHPVEVGDELAGDLLLGPGIDPVHGRDEQVGQRVGDLPLPAVHQGRQQGQPDLLRMGPQVAGCLGRGAGPPGRQHLRRDSVEQIPGQPGRPDGGELGDLLPGGLQAHVARVGLDVGERLRPASILAWAGIVAGSGDERGHALAGLRRDPRGDPHGQRLLCLPQRGANDPAGPAGGWELDPLGPAVLEEQLADPSARRSLQQTCSASQAVSFSVSATVHSRNPRNARIWARWYSNVRPDHSYSPRSAAGIFTWRAT